MHVEIVHLIVQALEHFLLALHLRLQKLLYLACLASHALQLHDVHLEAH